VLHDRGNKTRIGTLGQARCASLMRPLRTTGQWGVWSRAFPPARGLTRARIVRVGAQHSSAPQSALLHRNGPLGSMGNMSTVWGRDESGWKALAPSGFPDEAALHDLVEDAPQLLPLSGRPQLIVLGREVQLGPGRADLLAVEPDGRLAIVEVKLRANPEARRAIVSQILSYGAYLQGMSIDTVESSVLGAPSRQGIREYHGRRHKQLPTGIV
jgi:hypothetical protein